MFHLYNIFVLIYSTQQNAYFVIFLLLIGCRMEYQFVCYINYKQKIFLL